MSEFFLGAFETDWQRRRAALLHELATGQEGGLDWDWRRRGGVARLPEMGGRLRRGGGRRLAGGTTVRSMRDRYTALARGSQPAVVKLASYGGAARVGAMVSYTAREGALAVENERGESIQGKDALTQLRGEWEHLFDNRADSRDVAMFNVALTRTSFDGRNIDAEVSALLKAGFGDRRFVFAIDEREGDEVAIRGVVVLRDRSGERLTGDSKAADIVRQRFDESELGSGIEAHFRFHGYGNGVRFATARVRDLVERFNGGVRDETGHLLATSEDAGDLVQKSWRHEMHSRKGRDVVHLIVSARAGTDPQAFQKAVRDFLGVQFGGHRYVFAVHDPSQDPKEMSAGGKRPHIHAHAIITMRSETGERIHTSPKVFREWRSRMAEQARDHGIDMEFTDRRDQSSAPAYVHGQVRPVTYEGRTEHKGTSQAAQVRYEAKRENVETIADTARSRSYVASAEATWRSIAAD
ncbi:MAG: relaxase/mobilization nuclease domain-containing protein, partial [Afipia sp.]|nr:relaxase/mobilization nuclease domain-containing protein [Afipia sp.]